MAKFVQIVKSFESKDKRLKTYVVELIGKYTVTVNRSGKGNFLALQSYKDSSWENNLVFEMAEKDKAIARAESIVAEFDNGESRFADKPKSPKADKPS